jgi:hypothetical protein
LENDVVREFTAYENLMAMVTEEGVNPFLLLSLPELEDYWAILHTRDYESAEYYAEMLFDSEQSPEKEPTIHLL